VSLAVVIMAAGAGTRMKSSLPKVLHEAAGRPLVEHVLRAALPLKPERIIVLVGDHQAQTAARLKGYELEFVRQDFSQGYGTGQALMQAAAKLTGFTGSVMVLNGDGPLITTATLSRLQAALQNNSGMALLSCTVSDPVGLGRIVRNSDGSVAAIVEEKDADSEVKKIHEINPGFYIFDQQVFQLCQQLTNDNTAGEYYVTDMVTLYLKRGVRVSAVETEDELETLGVNNRQQLAVVERVLQDRIRHQWLMNGVTMIAPEQTFIDDTVSLERDIILEPGVILKGSTAVAEGIRIGAYSYLQDVTIHSNIAPHTVLPIVD
jgi:bifunctional UDP-N-acetylglucosamine pyrophosphorylase / glucosamine-1-phosphate N-acetyltransferase